MFKYIKQYFYTLKYNERSWRYPFYDLKYGIQNLFYYFTLIWNDRDWDYVFWLKMNRLKLHRMEKLLRKQGSHISNIKDADSIHKTILIIDRIINDNYHELAYMQHDKKWGDINISWIQTDNPDFVEAKITRPNVTEQTEEQEQKEFKRCLKHEDYLKKQDLEFLTYMLNKYLYHWWN